MHAAVIADVFHTEDRLRSLGSVATLVVFAVIFAESGLMVGFFLPGDSLLFIAGLLSGSQLAPLPLLIIGCAIAAIAGDQVGYAFGRRVGPPLSAGPTPACSSRST